MTQFYSKTIIILLITSLVQMYGCSNKVTPNIDAKSKEPIGFYQNQISDLYREINGFKYDAFLMCMRKGHNNSVLVDSILHIEFYPNEWPGYTYVNKLKEIVQITDEKIKQDSIYLTETWLQDPNYYNSGNKRVIAHCLELFASEELELARQEIDSIRKIEWQKYKETLDSMYRK